MPLTLRGGTHMIRRAVLSVLGGAFFAALLSFAVPAKANCLNFCANNIGNYYYAGCTIVLWGNEAVVTCYYTEGASLVDPNIAE